MHVPGGGGTTLGAESAVHADVLVFEHHPFRLGQLLGDKESLIGVDGGGREPALQILLLAVGSDGQAEDRTDVDAGIALDTRGASKTVCMSQFRQRSTSRAVCSA